jgi:hypothetical protein
MQVKRGNAKKGDASIVADMDAVVVSDRIGFLREDQRLQAPRNFVLRGGTVGPRVGVHITLQRMVSWGSGSNR